MYAVAGQTPDVAAREAVALADLGATHVSAYSLTIEQGTPFGQLARRGRLPLCEDSVMAESFFAIDEALSGAAFVHYEISNYARPGKESQHNLGYWRGRDYWGSDAAPTGRYAVRRAPCAIAIMRRRAPTSRPRRAGTRA
jgi:oxygen-independent coproporphyrinogen-3 oxidase